MIEHQLCLQLHYVKCKKHEFSKYENLSASF